MEKRAKLRFPRSFLSSLTSCRTQNLLSDVIHNHQNNHQLNPNFSEIPFSSASSEPLLPPPASPARYTSSSYPSICRPRCHETFDQMVRERCILSGERKKLCGQSSSAFFRSDVIGKICSPVSPPKPYSKLEKQRKRKNWRRTRFGKERSEPFSSSCEDWFSSDDEREDDNEQETETETETLFSSSRSFISLSSDQDSIGSTRIQARRRPPSAQRREARKKRSAEVSAPPLEEKVKGSFAVVKRSSDPYNDFRTSMVEMIMEKQIFGEKELQQLLQCFLSLNPANHHRIIVEVFAEICDALFSNLC